MIENPYHPLRAPLKRRAWRRYVTATAAVAARLSENGIEGAEGGVASRWTNHGIASLAVAALLPRVTGRLDRPAKPHEFRIKARSDQPTTEDK